MIMPRNRQMVVFRVGDRIRVRLARHCRHFHATYADGRLGRIRGMVTAELLARDNALAVDPRDILTLTDFGDHIYSVDFTGTQEPDGELRSASEMEHLPAWASKAFLLGQR